jgi:hypothetical protein
MTIGQRVEATRIDGFDSIQGKLLPAHGYLHRVRRLG